MIPILIPDDHEENRMESAEDVRNLDWTAEWPKILDDSPVASEISAVTWVKNGSFDMIWWKFHRYCMVYPWFMDVYP